MFAFHNKINVNNRVSVRHPSQGSSYPHSQLRSTTDHTQFLNHNFEIVKQCLLKIKDIETSMGQSNQNTHCLEDRLLALEGKVSRNQEGIEINCSKIKEFENNIGDEFMVPTLLFRKKCMRSRKKLAICSTSMKQSEK